MWKFLLLVFVLSGPLGFGGNLEYPNVLVFDQQNAHLNGMGGFIGTFNRNTVAARGTRMATHLLDAACLFVPSGITSMWRQERTWLSTVLPAFNSLQYPGGNPQVCRHVDGITAWRVDWLGRNREGNVAALSPEGWWVKANITSFSFNYNKNGRLTEILAQCDFSGNELSWTPRVNINELSVWSSDLQLDAYGGKVGYPAINLDSANPNTSLPALFIGETDEVQHWLLDDDITNARLAGNLSGLRVVTLSKKHPTYKARLAGRDLYLQLRLVLVPALIDALARELTYDPRKVTLKKVARKDGSAASDLIIYETMGFPTDEEIVSQARIQLGYEFDCAEAVYAGGTI